MTQSRTSGIFLFLFVSRKFRGFSWLYPRNLLENIIYNFLKNLTSARQESLPANCVCRFAINLKP
jgi:hypothetical protein